MAKLRRHGGYGANVTKLREIGLRAGTLLDQQAVYFRWPDGSADIVEVTA